METCERGFQRFKSGVFDVDDKEHGKPPKRYEDAELQTLLDEDDAQRKLFLHRIVTGDKKWIFFVNPKR